jgi:hypothetical protein
MMPDNATSPRFAARKFTNLSHLIKLRAGQSTEKGACTGYRPANGPDGVVLGLIGCKNPSHLIYFG